MLIIDKNSYKTLKVINIHEKVPKEFLTKKFPNKPSTILDSELNLLLGKRLIYCRIVDADCNNNPIPDNNTFYISQEGKVYIENQEYETRKHWQSILLPHPLNLIISVLASILTVYIMNLLGLIK